MLAQDPHSPTVLNFLKTQRERMGIPEESSEAFNANMYQFSNHVRNIESDDRHDVENPDSFAKGVYQFLDDSVVTAKNRMRNRGVSEEYINSISSDPRQWNDEQADMMFYANMFSQTGSDAVLSKVATGDIDSMKEAYYRFHHTNPNEATRKRTDDIIREKQIALPEDQEDDYEEPPMTGKDYEEAVSMLEQAQQVSQLVGLGGDELEPEIEEAKKTLSDYQGRLSSIARRRGLGIQDAKSDVQVAWEGRLKEHRDSGSIDPDYRSTAPSSGWKWAEKINYTPSHSPNGVLEIAERIFGDEMFDKNGDLQLSNESITMLAHELDTNYQFFTEGGFIDQLSSAKKFDVPDGVEKETLLRALLHQDISYRLGTWAIEGVNYGEAQSGDNQMGLNNKEYIKWIEEHGNGDSFTDTKNGLEIINGYQVGHIDSPLMAMDGSGFETMSNSQKDDAFDALTGYHVFDGKGRRSPFRKYFKDPDTLGGVEWFIQGLGKSAVRGLNMFGLAHEPVDLGDDPEIGAGWDMLGYMLPTVAAVYTTKGLGGGTLLTSSVAGLTDAAIQLVTPREENAFNLIKGMGENQVFSGLTGNDYIPYLSPVLEGLDDITDSQLVEALTIRQGNSDAQNALIGVLEGAVAGAAVGGVFVGSLAIVGKTLAVGGKGVKLSGKAVNNFSKKAKKAFGWDEHQAIMFEKGLMEGEGRLMNMYGGLPVDQLVGIAQQLGKGLSEIFSRRATGKLSSQIDFKEAVELQELELQKVLDSFDEGGYSKGDIDKIRRAIDEIDASLAGVRSKHGAKVPKQVRALVNTLKEAQGKLQAGHEKVTGQSYRPSGTYLEGREDLYKAADDYLRSKHRERELDVAAGDGKDSDSMLAKLKNNDGTPMTLEDARTELKLQKRKTEGIHHRFLEVAQDSKHNSFGAAEGANGEGMKGFHGTVDDISLYDYLTENYGYSDSVGSHPEKKVGPEKGLSDEEYQANINSLEKKMKRMKKGDLQEMAESQGIDSSGTKKQISDRILAKVGEDAKPKVADEPTTKAKTPKPVELDLDEMNLTELRSHIKENNLTVDGKSIVGRSKESLRKQIKAANAKKENARVKIKKKAPASSKSKSQTKKEALDLEMLKRVVARGAKELASGNRIKVSEKTPPEVLERVLNERLIDRMDVTDSNGNIEYGFINDVEPDPVKRAVQLQEEITYEIEAAKAEAVKNGAEYVIPPMANRLQGILGRLIDKMNKLGKIGLTIEDISGKWEDGKAPKSTEDILSIGAEKGKKAYDEDSTNGVFGGDDSAVPQNVKPRTEEPEVEDVVRADEPEVKDEPADEAEVKDEPADEAEPQQEVADSARDNARSDQAYNESELDDAAENVEIAKGGDAVIKVVTKRTVQFIQARAEYNSLKKGAPKVDKEKAGAKMMRAFVMLQRALAKQDAFNGKPTQKGFMARKVLPPMYREGEQTLIEWSKRAYNRGMLTPKKILALTNKYNVGHKYNKNGFKHEAFDKVSLHNVSDEGVAAMLEHFHTNGVLKTRRVHRPLNPLEKDSFTVSLPRIAQLVKDFGNSGLVSGIGTQFAAAQGLALKKPRWVIDSLALKLAALGSGDVARMAHEVVELEKIMRNLERSGKAPATKKEILQMLRADKHLEPEARAHKILRKLFVPSADNVYVVRGLEERGAAMDELRGSRDEVLTMDVFGQTLEVPSSGLTSLGYAASEIENKALRDFWLGAAAVQEGMARVVMSGFIDKATKNFGGTLHTRELLKELVSTKMDNGHNFTPKESVDMLRALREWNTGRAGGAIGFDEAQDVWMKNRLGLWTTKKEVPESPEGLSDVATEKWNEWQSKESVGSPSELQAIHDKLDTMYTADQNARSRMEELTLQHETDPIAEAFGELSRNPWTGLFAKFGKTSANTFTMGIESTPILGNLWRYSVKNGGANTPSDIFNSYAKQSAFVGAMTTAAGLMNLAGTSTREKFSVNERGDIVMRTSESIEKIKEKCMDRFAGSPELLLSMAEAHDAWTGNTNYAEDTDAYLEEILWESLAPDGDGEATMTYDRAGYIGNSGNAMVRAWWLMTDYSPRFGYTELNENGFMEKVDSTLGMLGVFEHGTTFASDVYKDIIDSATGDDPAEAFVNLMFLNRTMLPASGIVTDIDRYVVGSPSTKVKLDSEGEGVGKELKKASIFSNMFGDKLPSRVDFFSMPMESDEYDPFTAFLGRKDYQTTWYEDIFEDLALSMRAPSPIVFNNIGENDDVNFRDFHATADNKNFLNGYEAFNAYMLTDRYKSPKGRAVTVVGEAKEYYQSGDFRTRYDEVMNVRSWDGGDIKANQEVWDNAMNARVEIKRKFDSIRTKRIKAFRDLVRTERAKNSPSIAWMHNYVDSEGVSLYDRVIEKNGYSTQAAHEKAELKRSRNKRASELEGLINR